MEKDDALSRRSFIRAGTAGAAATVAAGTAAAQEGTENGTATATENGTATPTGNATATGTDSGTATGTEGGGGGGGPTEEVIVGPDGNLVFDPEELTIETGTTVRWVWDSDMHNVVPQSQPEGANWEGEGEPGTTFDSGHEYSHTFDTTGTYEYVCTPHESAGMVGSIEVVEELPAAGGGGQKDLHEIGAPIHPHWVGAATILMMFVSLVFTFYVLKYGESPNTGNTGGGE